MLRVLVLLATWPELFWRIVESLDPLCNFSVVDGHGLTWQEFRELYWEKKPVVFENMISDWPAMRDTRWTSESLIKDFGAYQFDSSYVSGNNRKGPGAACVDNTTLEEFLGASNYFRGSWFLQQHTPLARELLVRGDFMPLPRALKSIHEEGPMVSLGRLGQSNIFHKHENNWFAQVRGSKRWFVSDGLDDKGFNFDPGQTWDICRDDRLKVIPHCDLRAGQVLYVPSNLDHATCVLEEHTVAVAFVGSTPFEREDLVDLSLLTKLGRVTSRDLKDVAPEALPELVRIASGTGSSEVLELLLAARAGPLDTGAFSQSALEAARNGHVSILRHLLDIRRQTTKSPVSSALIEEATHTAAVQGHVSLVEFLMQQESNPAHQRGDGIMASAAKGGHISVLRHFIDSGIDVRGSSGLNRVLSTAAFSDLYYVVEFLHDRLSIDLSPLLEHALEEEEHDLHQFLTRLLRDRQTKHEL